MHEKKLLAIVCALDKWWADLLGVPFTILTDHRTLECFQTQKHLSRQQARWTEFLQQYNFDIVYVRGNENSAADALSRTEFPEATREMDASHMDPLNFLDKLDVPVCSILCPNATSPFTTVQKLTCKPVDTAASIMEISQTDKLYNAIINGYNIDPWCVKAVATKMDGLEKRGRLLYYKNCLVIPHTGNLTCTLVSLAHNSLGHFGFDKTYAAMRDTFYWPSMRTFLEHLYIPSCELCQKIKSPTTKPVGPLYPLPVPSECFSSVAIDFVGPFPEDEGYTYILTMADHLGADIRLVPCHKDITAQDLASLFFDHWFCENGLPNEIISDRDVLFLSRFWKYLHELTGVALKMSTAFHPQTDEIRARQ